MTYMHDLCLRTRVGLIGHLLFSTSLYLQRAMVCSTGTPEAYGLALYIESDSPSPCSSWPLSVSERDSEVGRNVWVRVRLEGGCTQFMMFSAPWTGPGTQQFIHCEFMTNG